jgi:hypothetical protein
VSRLSEIGRAIGLELCNKFKWFDIDMNFAKTIRKPADLDNEYTEAQLTELIESLKHELMNNLRYAPEKKIVCNRIYELEFLRSQLKYGVTV